jgi:hypothetical protein
MWQKVFFSIKLLNSDFLFVRTGFFVCRSQQQQNRAWQNCLPCWTNLVCRAAIVNKGGASTKMQNVKKQVESEKNSVYTGGISNRKQYAF